MKHTKKTKAKKAIHHHTKKPAKTRYRKPKGKSLEERLLALEDEEEDILSPSVS